MVRTVAPATPAHDLFLRACRREQVERVPVWFMRQAGRYDPDYRKIKQNLSLLEICARPELAAEVTMMPVRKLGVDAAILYSDIMNPVASLGIPFDIVKDVGPVIHRPIRTGRDVAQLKPFDAENDMAHVLETIRLLRKELTVPLITFAGAPFTLASYLIEGRPTKHYLRTKALMYGEPDIWFLLMDRLADMAIGYLRAQIAAGAQAVQLFDSWAGALAPHDFVRYVYPAVDRIFAALSELPQPKIYFPGVASGELLPAMARLRADVIGLDWRVPISEGRRRLGARFAIQGNLDPLVLAAPPDVIREQARRIVDEGIREPGFVFNLGHGLFPEASLDKLKALTEFVQTYSREALLASGPRVCDKQVSAP